MTPPLGSPAVPPSLTPALPAPPPPGAAAPAGTKMATETTLPGVIGAAPMASAQAAGVLVIAPVAPISGSIPHGVDVVAVAVKPWWQSTEIMTALGVIVTAGLDAALNGILPLLAEGPVDGKAIRTAFLRAFVTGAVGAFLAYRRATSNTVVR